MSELPSRVDQKKLVSTYDKVPIKLLQGVMLNISLQLASHENVFAVKCLYYGL